MARQKVVTSQNVSRNCIVCGVENQAGLHARFLELDNRDLLGLFETREEHQGYPGRVHGGILSAILDETIGRAVNISTPGSWGVTLELTVKYRQPVPLSKSLRCLGRITSYSGRIFEGTGELLLPDGSVAVEANGRYLQLPLERIAAGDFSGEWMADERQVPEFVDL